MASNYPPGVTGNEYAIGGPQREWEEEAHCPVCGTEDNLIHTFHPETGVIAYCVNRSCPAYRDGFEVSQDIDAEPDLDADR